MPNSNGAMAPAMKSPSKINTIPVKTQNGILSIQRRYIWSASCASPAGRLPALLARKYAVTANMTRETSSINHAYLPALYIKSMSVSA